jgi:hypothetical protein
VTILGKAPLKPPEAPSPATLAHEHQPNCPSCLVRIDNTQSPVTLNPVSISRACLCAIAINLPPTNSPKPLQQRHAPTPNVRQTPLSRRRPRRLRPQRRWPSRRRSRRRCWRRRQGAAQEGEHPRSEQVHGQGDLRQVQRWARRYVSPPSPRFLRSC